MEALWAISKIVPVQVPRWDAIGGVEAQLGPHLGNVAVTPARAASNTTM
jgi:hypothetical protein